QAVSHIGMRIEEPCRRAGIAHGARRPEADLHQSVIAGMHRARIAAALAGNDALDQWRRQARRARLPRVDGGNVVEGATRVTILAEAVLRRRVRRAKARRIQTPVRGKSIGSRGVMVRIVDVMPVGVMMTSGMV